MSSQSFSHTFCRKPPDPPLYKLVYNNQKTYFLPLMRKENLEKQYEIWISVFVGALMLLSLGLQIFLIKQLKKNRFKMKYKSVDI